jgi:integrase
MRQALSRVAEVLGAESSDPEVFAWHNLRYEDARCIAAALQEEGLKPATINKCLSAVRGTLEAAWRSGMMPDEVYRRIEIENVAGNRALAGRALDPAEMDAIASVLDKEEPRNAALIAVLAGTGARRIEVVRIMREDYADGRLTLTGKRNKRREVPVGKRWMQPIIRWHSTLNEGEPMFVFDVKDPRGAISYFVESFCKRHKLNPFTPHDLRRTFGTHVEKVAGIAVAQKLLGHENIRTTSLYVRVDAAREAAAVENL